jgi:CTP:molybdopterin cytidylyltransferase MocA
MKINGLLIAAGFSRRMGEFKPLMKYNDNPFIVTITKKLLNVCENVIIVTGHKSIEVEDTIKFAFLEGTFFPRVRIIINPDYEKGMFTSLQAGIRTLSDSEWVLYHFVDQPFHKEKFYNQLVAQIDNKYDWIQPLYDGKEGHPVIFRKSLFEKIVSKPAEYNLRLIRDDGITKKKNWECGYPQILKDFDTPEDLSHFAK